MRCQFNLTNYGCHEEGEYINKNGVIVCEYHKMLISAFNWEIRHDRFWERIKEETKQ